MVFVAASTCGVASHASFANVTALDAGEVTRIHCFPEDKVWRFSFFEADLNPTPKWNPQRSSAAPLSLATAIEHARADIPRYVHDPALWLLDSVELEQHRDTGWWYYVVTFALNHPKRNEAVSIPVLMDGTTIKGKRDPHYRPGDDDE
jgi:hypothetical protein